jgi:virginiamycin B lyase
MAVRSWTRVAFAIAALTVLASALPRPTGVVIAQGGGPALAGEVQSSPEGRMEGVLVSARRAGSNKTVTVVTDAKGAYAFPRERLEPGKYDVTIRAIGYVLAARTAVDITPTTSVKANLTLRPSNILELAHQMTDPEWLASYPLDDQTKFNTFRDCSRCHTMLRASMSTYNADQLAWVMKRMVYSAGSSPMTFQLPQGPQSRTWGRTDWGQPSEQHRSQAAAVAAINLSRGMWEYELKKLPRPKGKETQVIYTTWDLPVTARPHDTRKGKDGAIWFNHFNDNAIGRLDIQTGQVKEWKWPYRGDANAFSPTGARTLMGPDAKGRFYIGNQAQDGLVVFDPATETFRFGNPPGGGEMMDVSASHVDGFGWRVGGGAAHRINIETFESQTVKGPRPLVAYDIAADTKNNVYGAARNGEYVWKVDAKTMTPTYYDIPKQPRGVGGLTGGMRRGITDAQDRLWWGGYDGNFVGMLDPRQPAGSQMKLYPMPIPWFFPYDAHYDNVRYTWTAGIYADRVGRLNVETGEWSFYLLPFEANIRDIDLDPARNGGLSGLWLGHNHQGKITHVEPLAR